MSARGRVSREREPRDFYPTPRAAFPPALVERIGEGPSGEIWEPCMGDGRLVRWMQEAGYTNVAGSDLALGCDYLQDLTFRPVVVTNPPFSIAFAILQHARKHSGAMFFLLPLGFLASARRREWYQANPVNALFVLSERPNFVMVVTCDRFKASSSPCSFRGVLSIDGERPRKCPECGGRVKVCTSDACDYAWFYWGPRHRGIFHL